MLQHLWAGPISNATVDVVQGRYSVEVHSVGVTKVTSTIVFISFVYISSITNRFSFSLICHMFSLLCYLREVQWSVSSEK